MDTGLLNMTHMNGQLSLVLTATDSHDQLMIDTLRRMLVPVKLEDRHIDPAGTGKEVLVIPLEHLVAPKAPTVKPLPDSGFRKVIDGLAHKRR